MFPVPPPQVPFFIDPVTLFITELQPPGIFLGTMVVGDLDIGQTLRCYKAFGDPAFIIFPNCSVYSTVTINAYIGSIHRNISVIVGDNGVPPLNSSALMINITILVVNTAPTPTSPTSLTLIDTTPVGLVVYNATATDREGDLNTFTIVAGNRCRFPNSDVFIMDNYTGAMWVSDKRALDYKFCRAMTLLVLVMSRIRSDDPRPPPYAYFTLAITVQPGVRSRAMHLHALSACLVCAAASFSTPSYCPLPCPSSTSHLFHPSLHIPALRSASWSRFQWGSLRTRSPSMTRMAMRWKSSSPAAMGATPSGRPHLQWIPAPATSPLPTYSSLPRAPASPSSSTLPRTTSTPWTGLKPHWSPSHLKPLAS